MAIPSTLISSKLHPPDLGRSIVRRPRLTRRLGEFVEARTTLISAPAGYGKTVLVADWLDSPRAPRAAWLSLDPQDGDLERFSKYFVAAVQHLEPTCLAGTSMLIAARNHPAPEQVAESLVVELSELAPTVVVLDDLHVVRSQDVQELIQHLVGHLPDSLHLVIVTRADPPLPLSLWRSRDWLRELRAVDLRLSREETRELLSEIGLQGLSEDALDLLHRKTEGWVAGIRLFQLALSEARDPEEQVRNLSESDRLVTDYLTEEVVSAQPPEVRDLLAMTAPLERFCAPLCDHLAASLGLQMNGREQLERLYHTNAFLFPLGRQGHWYRYHHLFRQLLLERLELMAPVGRQIEICRRAGEWFAREGWPEEALHYLIEAGELDSAADVIAMQLHDSLTEDPARRTLARWLRMFPPGAESGRLPLIIATLYMKTHSQDLDAMEPLLDEAERCRDPVDDRHGRWWQTFEGDLEFLTAYTLYWSGDIDSAFEHVSRGAQLTADPRGFHYSMLILYLGVTLALSRRDSEYVRFIEDGIAEAAATGSAQLGAFLSVKAFVHFYRGELEACRRTVIEMIGREDVAIPKFLRGHGEYLLGRVAYERNRLDEAEAHFDTVEDLRLDMQVPIYHGSLLGLALVHLARRDSVSAKLYSATARTHALRFGSSGLLRGWESVEWRLDLAGHGAATVSGPPNLPDFTVLWFDPPSQSWAWLQLEESSPGGSTELLGFIEEALLQAAEHGVELRAIQLGVLRAAALAELGRRGEADECLEDAVRRAEPLGLVRSFLDGGERVRELLLRLATRCPQDTYVGQLLAEFDAPEDTIVAPETQQETAGPPSSPPPFPREDAEARRRRARWEVLTHRELAVLELLQERLTNKEIAARLLISSATVKKHSLSLYRKLGVHGRREAVAEALERGILRET